MPRISKIRLTGCKYDGLRKQHENSIFDLTKDEDADHALFTLCNGGGKGVMMQLIFQLLLPGTRWGKNDGNKVISMFYDQRNNLHPFTFHIALEWILDTFPARRLITGITVKAIVKNTSKEEEEQTGLSYFLYTHEHDNNGYYTIENLPLYDTKTHEAVDIDVFNNFLNDNKRDFIKYSQSSVRRRDGEYYRYLESRGIYRSEWLNLKTINKSEGGVGDYFIGASDNKAIFDKVIIPAISENIRNYTYDDGKSLIEMFKSNLSITKDLPVLIKREGDYKELLVEIEPLIENADSGSRFIDMKNRLIGEGNDIYYILKNEENKVKQEIEKWTNEQKRAEEEKKELEFRKDNFYYNKEKKELEDKEKEGEKLNIIFKEKSKAIEANQQNLLLYNINKILFHKNQVEENINNKILEKERLMETLDISDIKQRAEELNDEIELEWNKTKACWINNENQYAGYMKYTNQIILENKIKKKKHEAKKDELHKEINKFELKKDSLADKKRELEQYYDPLSLAFPERILEDIIKLKEEIKEEIQDILNEIGENNKKVSLLSEEINKLRYILKTKEEEATLLKKEIIRQDKYELEIARRLTKQLLENYDGSLLNHNWFANKQEELEQLENNKKENLEGVKRTIWEKNITQSLNKEDYFIPNKDIVLIKEEIKSLGIHVETGIEYLKRLDENEKEDILKNYPTFLYSLVIGSKRDWELIDKNISKNLFLSNVVPIYIRSEMKSNSNAIFKVLFGKAYEMIDENIYKTWKNNMEDEIQTLLQTEHSIRHDLKNIEEIKQELKFIAKKDTGFILNQKLKELEEYILEIYDKIRTKKEEKLNIEDKLSLGESKLKKNNERLDEIYNSIKILEEYIKKKEEIEKESKSILNLEKDIEKINQTISNIEYDNEGIEDSQNTVKDSYYKWKAKLDPIIKDIKLLLKEAVYEYKLNSNYINYNIPDFLITADKLISLIDERKMLEEDILSKDSSIAVLDTEIKYLRKELNNHIVDLNNINRDWNSYSYLELPLNEIIIIIDEIKRTINVLEEEKTNTKSKLDIILGNISIMKKGLYDRERAILKAHNRAPIILEIEDIKNDINIVERDIKSNEKYLSLCIDELKKNEKNSTKLEINLTKIKAGYELDLLKGKMDKILKEKIKDNPDLVMDEWLSKCGNNRNQINKTIDEGEKYRSKFIKEIGFKLKEDKLKEQIILAVKEANISNFKNNIVSFKSMKSHFEQELLKLSKDKEKADNAMKQWTNRASIYVMRMIDALKDMVSSMNYTNEQGYVFPLVKLKGTERLPKEEGEITYLLDEYFVETIAKILETNEDIDNIDDRVLNNLMGDKAIFSKALQGRYPTLLVYKMSEKNEFRYARARDEYYTTWEAINKGEGDLPEGSGGQTLSVNTFVIMMIMSFKKKHIGNEKPSTVLILDNPFGKASAKHVLDPIFEIADKLNFQLICFAAPEIIKMEISERFPIFWELKIEDGKIVHGGRVIRE